MSLSSDLRNIQNSESYNKVDHVHEIFGELISDCIDEIRVLQVISKIACKSIDGPQNFDELILPRGVSLEFGKNIGRKYGINISEGGSGTIYISWNRSLDEEEVEQLCNRLHEAGHKGLIYEEFDRLKALFPERKLELCFTTHQDAERKARLLDKKAYPVFKGAIYLLSR